MDTTLNNAEEVVRTLESLDARGSSITIEPDDDANDSDPVPPKAASTNEAGNPFSIMSTIEDNDPPLVPFWHSSFKVHNKNQKPILVLAAAANAITDIVNTKGSFSVGVLTIVQVSVGIDIVRVPRVTGAGDHVVTRVTVQPGKEQKIQVQKGTDGGVVVDIVDLDFLTLPAEKRMYHCHTYLKLGSKLTISGEPDLPVIDGLADLFTPPQVAQ